MLLPGEGVDAPSPWREYQSGRHPTVMVSVDMLRTADSPRVAGENADHVRSLATLDVCLPPIIVHRPTMRVIDGMHRLRAAALRAQGTIEARFFDGDEHDAFVLGVEANTGSGLPLSLLDRRCAASRIITTHPYRSDRWIALVTGLTAKTVGAIRRCSTVEDAQSNTRVGRDGRVRPLDSSHGRRLAAELMAANPDRSLRDIARAAGIAPSTALDVRNRLNSGADPVPARDAKPGPAVDGRISRRVKNAPADLDIDPAGIIRTLRRDPSLRFTEAGRALLRWLDVHTVDPRAAAPPVQHIPAHCIGMLSALARHNARFWTSLSEQLDFIGQTPQDLPATCRGAGSSPR